MLPALLVTIASNAIPLLGALLGGWGSATVLALYWTENLIGSLLVALRSWLHQRWTGKRGHFRTQFATNNAGQVRRGDANFTVEFLVTTLVFTLAHGVFTVVILLAMNQPLDTAALRGGAIGLLLFQAFGFVYDAIGLRERSFAWLKQQAQFYLGRVVLIHLGLIAGIWLAAFTGNANVFLPFAVLKLLSDVALRVNTMRGPQPAHSRAPAWMVRLANRARPGEDFEAHLAREFQRETEEAAEDETPHARTGRRS
jgi:hypothetical protein